MVRFTVVIEVLRSGGMYRRIRYGVEVNINNKIKMFGLRIRKGRDVIY